MRKDSLLQPPIIVCASVAAMIPLLIGLITNAVLWTTLLGGAVTFSVYLIFWIVAAARAFRSERDVLILYRNRMKKQRDDAWYERDTANLTKKILQALLDEARQERDDLQDEIEDLKVTAVKVGQQQALIKTLQKRIENLNQQINYGGRLRHTATTLEDVLKLTGEIKTPEPSFTDLDELEEDDVR